MGRRIMPEDVCDELKEFVSKLHVYEGSIPTLAHEYKKEIVNYLKSNPEDDSSDFS